MIIKSYEIQKKPLNLLKYKLLLFYGENNGLKKDIKESIVKSIGDKKTMEFLSLYENDIVDNDENFYNSIFSGSLFHDKKFITISNGTDKILKPLEHVVDKLPENIFIVVFAEVLEKKSKLRNFFEKNEKTLCVACYLDNERDLSMIAKNELKNENIFLSTELINFLIEKSSNDRENLRNEIQKIKLYALNNKNLKVQEIKNLINFSGEIKSDHLVNECLCGHILQYKKKVSELYTNTINQIFILRILGNKIQRLLKMKELEKEYSNVDNMINALKPPIFWKEKPMVKKQLAIWSLDALKKIVYEINDTDLMCKKNPEISKIIFFKFFTNLCKKASNYS